MKKEEEVARESARVFFGGNSQKMKFIVLRSLFKLIQKKERANFGNDVAEIIRKSMRDEREMM